MRVRPRARLLSPAALLTLALAFPAAMPAGVQAQPAPAAASPVISGVDVKADSLSPGSTLDFTVRGTPGGQARVQLVGSGVALPLQESTPGVYTGRYTVASGDRIDTSRPVQATLRAHGLMAISESDFRTGMQARAATPAMAPGAAAAGTGALGAAPMTAAPLALQVLSPAAGSPVESSKVVIQGHTLPNALVHAQVHAVPPMPTGAAAVALPVTEQTVQADASGNFSFTLGAQPVPAGARLDVDLDATQGNQTTPVQRYVLYQRQG